MNTKQNVLILFEGPHLAYSPTTIQLYDELSKKYSVTLVAQNPDNYNGKRVSNRNVFYYRYYGVKTRHFYLIFFHLLSLFSSRARMFKKLGLGYRDYFFRFLYFKRFIKKDSFHRIISVDISNLFFCSLLDRKTDFLSLEICKDHHLLELIKKETINCVIIQSEQRYNFILKGQAFRKFIIPNSPVYYEIPTKQRQQCLIYSGAAHDSFGFFHCLKYLKKYPDEKMVLQGALLPNDRLVVEKDYPELLAENRLVINLTYFENDEVVDFISDYEIGFCFYNFDHPYVKANAFNYMSAPSGKMFKYLAAGVPVVCSNIDGFSFVKEFQCGILVNSLNEDDIRNAVLNIRDKYEMYVENAKKAGKYFSFDKAILPYIDFISSPV